jgi:Family of unknown function (DUF6585)
MSEPAAPPEYPEELQDAFARVGPPREVFAGSTANAVAGIILGTLGVIAGAAVAIFMVAYLIFQGFDIRLLSGLAVVGLGVGGWATLRWGIRNRSARMYVCEKGVIHHRAGTATVYPWADLTGIMQDRVKDGLDENGYPFMNRNTTFLIKRRDGSELGIDANALKQHVKFMRAVYTASRPYEVPWTFYQG